MKKLIISMVATASIALVAKAEVPNGTSFEGYEGDFAVGKTDNGAETGNKFWSGGKDGQFDIKALAGDGGLGAKTVDRPKYWTGVADANALAIDTDDALVRNINSDKSAMDIGNGLYFDSMVQFTATTDAPQVEANTSDKLVVWLKEIEGTEGQPSTYKLCVTAGVWDEVGAERVDYQISNISVAPDSWHRLSIAVKMAEGDIPTFNVYVDGVEAKAGDVVDFQSLVYDDGGTLWKQITSVSFQGKGAIDDLVWTLENPIAAPTKSYTVIVDDSIGSLIGSAQYKIGEADEVSVSLYDGETDETADFALAVPVDATSVTFFLAPGEDYEVVGGTFVNDRWVVTVQLPEAGSQITLKIIEKQVVEPDPVKPFTVTIAGVDTPFETLAKAITAAEGATIKLTETATLTEKLTVDQTAVIDLNGQTLTLAETDNYAVVVKAALTITDSSSEKSGTVVVPGEYGFGMTAGSLTINAGNFVATDADYLIGAWAGTVAISGGDFTAEYCVVNLFAAAASAEISGGTFTVAEESDGYPCYVILSEVGGKVAVSAGLFSTIVEEAFCAEGYIPTTEAVDGYYTVVRGYAVTVEAANATVTGLAAKYAADATITFTVAAVEGYEVKSVTADKATVSATANAGEYTFKMPAEAVTIVVTTEAVVVEPEYPEVDAEEGETVTESFSDDAKAVIKDAFTVDGVYVKPSAPLAVEVNGEALKGDEAVKMINEVVEKFSGNPFTNGKLELTFKVTDVMEVLKGAGNGFTLTVGTATLKNTYVVAPKYIDLATKAESFDAPADGAVIFKLVIKPVAAQQN